MVHDLPDRSVDAKLTDRLNSKREGGFAEALRREIRERETGDCRNGLGLVIPRKLLVIGVVLSTVALLLV
jgi:hypothetical protein